MTDSEIIEGLKKGSSEAFTALYEAQSQQLALYVFRICGRREMAEEITHEALLTVVRKIAFFKVRRDGGFRSWIFRIATHLTIDVLRREKKFDLVEEFEKVTGELESPHSALERSELSRSLEKALTLLTPVQRAVFLLKEEGLSCMEISRVCGCSENAVKQGLFRARSALKVALCN